jgi:hypothetical protein
MESERSLELFVAQYAKLREDEDGDHPEEDQPEEVQHRGGPPDDAKRPQA